MPFMKRIFIFLTALCLLLSSCGQQESTTEATTVSTTEATTVPTTEATTVPTAEATTVPTAEPPQRTVPLHSGIQKDGTFDGGTLFIGDSLTNTFIYDNLMLYRRIGDAKFMAIVGAPVHTYFFGPVLTRELTCIYSGEFQDLTFSHSVELYGENVTAVYFMLGSNYSEYTTYETYSEIVEHLMEHCPKATIYLQTIPY